MNINICKIDYTIEEKVTNLLDILFYIKENKNNSLAFRSGCRSGVCGSCSVKVNGVEKLACKTTIKDNDSVKALDNIEIIKDLVVDFDKQSKFLNKSNSYLISKSEKVITSDDEKLINIESNCILCNSCFSSCPIYQVNQEFIGPFALVRAYRYIEDKKESDISSKIDNIQNNGIWDCTLCGNCNVVCPSKIDIKNDIIKLRNKSVQLGYNDPNLINNDFNLDFGFNPNQF